MNEQEHSLEVLQQAMNSEALVTLMNMTIGVMAAQPAASAALEAVIREEALSIETRSGRASFVDGESIAAEPEAPAHNNVESSEPEIKREQLDTEPSKPDHKADEPVEHSVPRESVHAVADSQQPEARPASVEAQSREIATEDADAIPTNVDAANAIENVSGDEVDPKLIEQQLAEHHETAKAVDAVVAQALEPAEPAHPEPAHPEPTHPEPNQPVEAVATMEVNGAPTQSALLLTQETVVASSGQTNGELEPHQAQQAESTVLEAQKPDEAQVGPHPVEVIAHTIQPPPVLEQPANLPEPTKDETPAKAPESVQETETPVPQIAPVASVPSAAVVVAAPVPSHATNPPEALPQSIESKGPTASAKDKPGSAHAAHEDSKETHVSPSLGHALEQKSPSEAKMHLGESRTSSPKPSAIPELTVTIPTGETQVLTPPDTKKSKKGGILSPFKKLFKFFSKK
ncbi:uncharacterized protein BJ171DRAFT_505797 [Polychytrium aggregatum]|uniref:uncharacterized protein n=1 Tax=Polychytrium aggregatum TaxID=110093 RepID=UPI0022FE3F19|nr:uncharacterized protein BJ171DRAFT_505797 [Polychytrium aggregatum]KAI9204417.1 hypothetical protein BJ171DRAFT_505797 [Polychytrium aggregatum]